MALPRLKLTDIVTPESRFRRNILRIASGTFVSQGIAILAMPFLARLYAPEDFGSLAVFTAIHAVVAALFTLKYDLAIILPTSDGKAFVLTVLTLVSSLFFSSVLLVVALLTGLAFGYDFAWYFYLLPLSAVLGAGFTCAQQWSARVNDYRRFSRSQIVNSVATVTTALLTALLIGRFAGALVISYIVGLALAVAYLSIGGRGAAALRRRRALPRPRLLRKFAMKFKRFPLLVLPSSFMATLSQTGQPFVLQSLFSLRVVGLYAVANRVLVAPSALVGGAVSEAFRAEFVARLKSGGPVAPFFVRTLVRLGTFAMIAFGVFFAIAPELFALLFGSEYEDAGVLSRYLSAGALAQFVAQPFGYVFVATDRVRLGLVVQFATTLAPLLGLVAGGFEAGITGALGAFSVLAVLFSALLIAFAYHCCLRHDRASAKPA